MAEGYPHFIQQFGYCAFQSDTDDIIDIIDVIKGAYGENGAIDQLGRKFFQEMYFDKISSEDYRKVLNAMADSPSVWHTRKSIMESSGVSKTQVNNALNALKARNIIIPAEGGIGEYRLPTKSFAVWIKAINEKNKNTPSEPFELTDKN